MLEVPMDALELLKQDHQKVKELFEQGQGTEDKKEQKRILREIKSELETHTRIEETVFYPAMEEHAELKDMVLESIEEHKQLKTILREISKLSPGSGKFKPKFKVLKDDMEHHAVEEEEEKMFPGIREIIDEAELEELGEELEAAKHKRLRKAS
jgi:hemerythrin superfamily protein